MFFFAQIFSYKNSDDILIDVLSEEYIILPIHGGEEHKTLCLVLIKILH